MHRIIVGWIALALLIAPLAAQEEEAVKTDPNTVKKASALFDKGVQAAQKGDLAGAEQLFQQSLKTYPLVPGAYVELGKIAMARQNPAQAVEFYLKARDTYHALHDQKLKDLNRVQNEERQRAQNSQTARNSTSGSGGFAKNAVIESRNQMTEDQRDIVKEHQEVDIPALFYLYLGGAYMRLGKHDLAEQEFTAGIRRDPALAPLHFNLAVVYLVKGRYDQSATEARTARDLGFQLPPQFVQDLESRGKLKL
ncbi:MAG TPA: tetratricopeptide repeat protein [Acidobacteriota bacterium]|nr:tetratricopeptide repeat protein [Acidobacteriota bacterium]HQF87341.1 tetratricopeptide repeat protein [Acidobacteriota bacterium]HQG91915.1 tetratricopeptide repeat protein [Acidobacteriota bacterium]HQK86937.1 tetratricopeptide repeat protein [Acidobacteriota bacterium]